MASATLPRREPGGAEQDLQARAEGRAPGLPGGSCERSASPSARPPSRCRRPESETSAAGDPWARFRLGITQKLIYVAPRQKGARGRNRKQRKNFAGLLMERVMEPALAQNEARVERDFERMLDSAREQWDHVARSLVVNIVGDSSSLDRALKKSERSVDAFGRNVTRSTRRRPRRLRRLLGMGRSIAFAAGSFLTGAGLIGDHEVVGHGRLRPRAADLRRRTSSSASRARRSWTGRRRSPTPSASRSERR